MLSTAGFTALVPDVRGFRTGAALVLIVVYNEIIHQGATAANNGVASPLITLSASSTSM